MNIPNSLPASEMDNDDNMGVADLWAVIRRQRRMILVVVGAVTVVAALVAWILPNQYTATTKIQPGSPQMLAAVKGSTISAEIATALNLQQVFDQPDEKATLKALRRMITISVDKNENLLQIDVTYTDPELAAQIANEYFPRVVELASARLLTPEASNRRTMEVQLAEVKKVLADLEHGDEQAARKLSEEQLFWIQIIGDLRAEVALTSDIENNKQGVLRLQEYLASLERATGGVRAHGKEANVYRLPFAVQERHQDLAFFRSMSYKLERRIQLLRQQERVGVKQIAPALVPFEHSMPKRPLIVAFAFVAALLASLILALVFDSRSSGLA
jgi:tyrosine-protein kinase Etk/Wzc